MRKLMALAGVIALAIGAMGQTRPFLSEMMVNPDGGDNGLETVEITGPAGLSLNGYYFIVIEGDRPTAVSTIPGTVDLVINLSTLTLGTNGVGLVRDGVRPVNPPADPLTNIIVNDFVPDIENGSNTYVLGFGTPPTVGTDLDTNDDGTIDAPLLGFTAVDALSVSDGDQKAGNPPRPATDGYLEYADDFGGFILPVDNFDGPGTGSDRTYTPDAVYRLIAPNGEAGQWVAGDTDGLPDAPDFPSPYEWDLGQNNRADMVPPLPNDFTTQRPNGLPNLDLGIKNLIWGVSPGVTISGTLALAGFTGTLPTLIDIDVRNASNVSIGVQTITPGANGEFTVSVPATGTYILSTKFRTGLRKNVTVDATGGTVTGVAITLINGNILHDNNTVDIDDFLAMAADYEVSPLGNPNTDLTGDGNCDIDDFLILAGSYELSGDE